MTKVDFHVLWLQAGGGCKISEVQVTVIIIGRGCLVLLKFKFKLCRLCPFGVRLPCVNPTSLRAKE